MPHRVLVIDDDAKVRRYVARALLRANLTVETAGGGRAGVRMLGDLGYDAVVCDLRMPDLDGLAVLAFAQRLPRRPVFVVLTGFGSVTTATQAIRGGADDYIEKPIDLDELAERVRGLLNNGDRRSPSSPPDVLIGSSAWLRRFQEHLEHLARSDAPVLIEGPTGTGKSLVARVLWQTSPRWRGPFGVVNCGAVTADQLERELFGQAHHVTASGAGQPGRLEETAAGVLVLDDVSELPMPIQAKLLRLLRERSYQAVGADRRRPADVRLVSISRRSLWRAVQAGAFRNDLYFRLGVLRIRLPALSQRRADVADLVRFFAAEQALRQDVAAKRFTAGALRLLAAADYDWPGNVHELSNLVARLLVAVAGDVIERSHIAAELRRLETGNGPNEGLPTSLAEGLVGSAGLASAMRQYESRLIQLALDETQGNRSEAARLLKVSRSTLIDKIRRLGLSARD